jgi:hypothetical protein
LLGGYLVQRWQQRNWHQQQSFSSCEKEYIALKELADEVSTLLGIRLFRMKKLLQVINLPFEKVSNALSEYDEATGKWNDKLNSFYSRITILASYNRTRVLEDNIQHRLFLAGRRLERLVKTRMAAQSVPQSEIQAISYLLDRAQAATFTFTRDLVKLLERRRTELYFGIYVSFTKGNIDEFSNWQLIKALFVREIDSYSILCPPRDLRFPRERLGPRSGIY